MYAIAICAHEKRLPRAESLAETVGGVVVLDEEADETPVLLRSARTHDRAWAEAASAGEKWSVVLEDDAAPAEGFQEALRASLSVAPHGVVSLYLGDQSIPQAARRAADRAEKANASWVHHPDSRLFWGVGVALPTILVPAMLEGVSQQRYLNAYDFRLGLWAQEAGIPVNYVFPSLVDHIDDDVSLIGTLHRSQRRAQKVGIREQYDETTVRF